MEALAHQPKQRTRWLLTREHKHSLVDLEALRRAGIEALCLPCIECEFLPWPTWTSRKAAPLYFLTSPRAVQAYGASREALESGSLFAALEPSTAQALEDLGRTAQIRATGGVRALAEAVLGAWKAEGQPAWAIRYPTSDAGLSTPEQQQAAAALEGIGPVERQAVYLTRAPAHLNAALRSTLRAPWAVSFSSPSAVSAFLGHVDLQGEAPKAALCLGQSTLAAWNHRRPPAWPDGRATLSLLDAILEWEKQP